MSTWLVRQEKHGIAEAWSCFWGEVVGGALFPVPGNYCSQPYPWPMLLPALPGLRGACLTQSECQTVPSPENGEMRLHLIMS